MRNRAEDQMILGLIRHGETKANRERRYLGKTDEGLSRQGRESLMSRLEQNAYPEADFLFCSPMKRCRETAKILYPEMEPVIIPEWEEMDFGAFEYKNYEEMRGDVFYQAWIDSGGTLAFPNGESREAFISQCRSGFLHMCGVLCRMTEIKTGGTASAAAVVHGGTIKALLHLYGGKVYFDAQAKCGGGYLCLVKGWQGFGREKREKIKIEVTEQL